MTEFEAADASFDLLIRRTLGRVTRLFDLKEYHCSFRQSEDHKFTTCEATVKLLVNGTAEYTVEEGDGPLALSAGEAAALNDVVRVALKKSAR